MPYSREISRDNKACILFLLDQSYSMVEPLGQSQKRKCDELASAVNGWLLNMAIRASGDAGIRDWMDVGVIGYRTDQSANPIIQPILQGTLANRPLVSITDIGLKFKSVPRSARPEAVMKLLRTLLGPTKTPAVHPAEKSARGGNPGDLMRPAAPR